MDFAFPAAHRNTQFDKHITIERRVWFYPLRLISCQQAGGLCQAAAVLA
jgi:hypothetical protein